MDGWSVTQQMMVYNDKLLKKSSNRKSMLVLSMLVIYVAFKHHISFATDLASKFGCYGFRIVSKLLRVAIGSRCADQFESEKTPFPWTGHCDLDLLLCTGFDLEYSVLFLCHIFARRSMNYRKIERSDGRCFGQQQFLANSIENFISHEKNPSSLPNIYKALKPF